MKKALSILLSLLMVFSVIAPAIPSLPAIEADAATAGAGDAYATLFSVSDLQQTDYFEKMEKYLELAVEDGADTPDGFLFGGDFQTSSNSAKDITAHMDKIVGLLNEKFNYYNTQNIVFVKGNHDALDSRHSSTGIHEYDDYIVYVINENDLSAGDLADAKNAAAALTAELDRLLASGEDRPIFVTTHVPIHHNSRGDYLQSAYGRYLFDVLNSYGVYMDIIFMFGHNHSDNYDDYIGGSVNFLGKGDEIYISSYGVNGNTNYGKDYYTKETLNFTYMNYGYGAYAKNTDGNVDHPYRPGEKVSSTSVTTMGVIEICPDRIVVSRYTEEGKYSKVETIDRITKSDADGSFDTPYVKVAGYQESSPGYQTGAVANATGFGENATYTWASSNEAVAKVSGVGMVCQVSYYALGTADITVTVSDGVNTASDTYTVSVVPDGVPGDDGIPLTEIRLGTSNISDRVIEYYKVDLPMSFGLIGCYYNTVINGIIPEAKNQRWESSDALVATVEDGYVTFTKNGKADITYSYEINGVTYSAKATFIVSNGDRQNLGEVKYVQTSTLEAGKEYAIVLDYKRQSYFALDGSLYDGSGANSSNEKYYHRLYPKGTKLAGLQGSTGNFTFRLDNDSIRWTVESAGDGLFYLKNTYSGKYFNIEYAKFDDLVTGAKDQNQTYYRTTSFGNEPKTKWNITSEYGICAVDNVDSVFYSNSAGYAVLNDSEWDNAIRVEAGIACVPLVFERVVTGDDVQAHIEMGGKHVESTTQSVYQIKQGTVINLFGAYSNFGGNVVESWGSSNPAVATIENGKVVFTGATGLTEITYKIKSDNVLEKTLKVTLVAKAEREATRTFKYVTNIQPNKKYLLVYKSDITPGEAMVLSNVPITDKQLFPEYYEIEQNDVNDYLYIEIPESEAHKMVWLNCPGPEKGSNDNPHNIDMYYYASESSPIAVNGEGDYQVVLGSKVLGAEITGIGEWGEEGSLYAFVYGGEASVTDYTPFQMVYDGTSLYNAYYAEVSDADYGSYEGYTGVAWHGSGYFGIDPAQKSQIYMFEEIVPDPTAVILNNYEYVGKSVLREEVCPYQTEQLMGEAKNFPDGDKTFEWSSSNSSVATIDQTGKITYTGNAGSTTISLKITNSDGTTDAQSVELWVNASLIDDSNRYYQTNGFVPGYEYVIAHINNAHTGDAATKNDGLAYAISSGRYNTNVAKAEVTTVVDGAPKFIDSPSASTVWKCVPSDKDGYVYLVDENGWYLAIQYDSGDNDVMRSYPSMEGQVNGANAAISADSFLIKTDGNSIYSKSSGNRGISFSYGTNASSTKRFGVSSSVSKFELYGKEGETDQVYYLADALVDGKKYIIANTNVAGDAYIASINMYNSVTPRLVNGTVSQLGASHLIKNPTDALVLTCVKSENDGYFYLVDESGKRLTLYIDRTVDSSDKGQGASTYKVALSSPGEYDPVFSQLKYRINSQGLQILNNAGGKTENADGTFDVKSGYLTFYYTKGNTTTSNPRLACQPWPDEEEGVYLYALKEEVVEEIADPVTQIRVDAYDGNKDITNIVYYRYNITAGTTDRLLRYVANVNSGYSYTWSSSDTSIAGINNEGLITYTGHEGYVTITLTVTGTDLNGNAYSATVRTTLRTFNSGYEHSEDDYPEYPYEGSVRVNKTASNLVNGYTFQQSGVTEIELSATGVPVDIPLDVVVVFDHSSSMNSRRLLTEAIENTIEFALDVFDGNASSRFALVAFDSMGSRYSSMISGFVANSLNEDECGIRTGDETIEGAFMTADKETELAAQINALITNNVSGTNYDYGLKLAYDILSDAKSKGSKNTPIVVFMSDGAPNQFNGFQTSFDDSIADNVSGLTNKQLSYAWVSGDEALLNRYYDDLNIYPTMAIFNPAGDNWYAQALKTPVGTDTGLPALEYYEPYRNGLGAKIFTIGYGTEDTYNILSRMASTPDNYYSADTSMAGSLEAVFNEITGQFLYSATDAFVTDTLGDYFNLQLAENVSIGNETLSFKPAIEIGSWKLDSDGNRVSYSTLEKITFTVNAQGHLTDATSTVAGSVYNQAANKIIGEYVTYDLKTETFTWTIGDITRNEVTLKYLAYLDGAAQGTREGGIYDTNKVATLRYTNYRGTPAIKYFTTPALGWKQAAVSYEFYLVNAQGQPVNLSGIAVPFAERVIIGNEQTKALLLNSSGEVAGSVIATNELPDGYSLYNPDALYRITVSSTQGGSSAEIVDGKTPVTTYFRQGSKAVNVNGVIDDVTSYYNTAVSFAVVYSEGVVPDTVVIDYGLPVKISVLGNDYVVDGGEITGFAASVNEGTGLNDKAYASSQLINGTKDTLTLKYGKVTLIAPDLNDAWPMEKLVYTPTEINMPKEEVFYYEYNAGGKLFYAKVTIVPATSIYYEESFISFNAGTSEVVGNEVHNIWIDAGTTVTGIFQAEDRPGGFSFDEYDANNVYGYDSAYDNFTTYSLGSAKKTTVNYNSFNKEATASFTFSGTGFDFYSVTSSDTGAVQVTIKNSSEAIVQNYIVNTYYGYTGTGESLAPAENKNALYQIPVISKRDLAYGTYTVIITPRYSSAFDPNFDGTRSSTNAYSIYVDSVRIFNPAGTGTSVSDAVGDAYFADGEFSPEYKTVRSVLLSVSSYTTLVTNKGYNGTIFLDGAGEASVADYKAQGPNNEVYLSPGQAIAFELTTSDILTLASIQIGMKAVSGANATAVIMNSNSQVAVPMTVSGATENYYNISSVFEWETAEDDEGNAYYKTAYPVIIANASSDAQVISLTSFKWAKTASPEGTKQTDFMVYPDTVMYAARGMRTIMAAMDTELTEDKVTVEWAQDSFVAGETATLKVTTPTDVVSVMIDWEVDMECEIDENGNKLWTAEIELTEEGDVFYVLQLFTDAESFDPALMLTQEIYVDPAPVVEETTEEETTEEETTEEILPEEETTGSVESDEETDAEDTSITGRIKQMFEHIFNFFKYIIDFLRGLAK